MNKDVFICTLIFTKKYRMKKLVIPVLLMTSMSTAMAQKTKPAAKKDPAPVMKNLLDSFFLLH